MSCGGWQGRQRTRPSSLTRAPRMALSGLEPRHAEKLLATPPQGVGRNVTLESMNVTLTATLTARKCADSKARK